MLPTDIAKTLCEARQKAINEQERAEWSFINNNLMTELTSAAETGLSSWSTMLNHKNNVTKLTSLINATAGLKLSTQDTQKGTRVNITF